MAYLLRKLFKLILKYGYRVRKNREDGLQAWSQVKPFFAQSTQQIPPLSPAYQAAWTKVNYQAKSEDDVTITIAGYTFHNMKKDGGVNERDHFIIQLFRIPHLSNYSLSVLKLLQIAYNIGQLYADKELYPPPVLAWLNAHGLLGFKGYIE